MAGGVHLEVLLGLLKPELEAVLHGGGKISRTPGREGSGVIIQADSGTTGTLNGVCTRTHVQDATGIIKQAVDVHCGRTEGFRPDERSDLPHDLLNANAHRTFKEK